MKPLIVLLAVFVISLPLVRIFQGDYNFALSACIAMSAMLLFTAMGHFAYSRGMSMMLPGFIPYRPALVYLTGLIEIVLALGLLFPAYRPVAGWILIIFLVLVLPANVYASFNHVNYQTASYNGEGPGYLWFRVPLQFFFIGWIYRAAC